MNEENSTESTILLLSTHLLVSFNWISTLKLSSTRPSLPFLTLLFPLFLPSQLTQSILFASCYNNIICYPLQSYNTQPTLSISDLPSFFFTSTSIISKIIIANTPISENTSTRPLFQAFYIIFMPYLGIPGGSFFEGANISKFLERFENMCNDYQIAAFEKIYCLSWYYEMFTTCHVRFVIGFSELVWTKICTNLKKKYKNWDKAQQISSRTYLEVFKDKPRIKNAEVLQFCRDYSEISKELLEKRKLDKHT